MVRKVPVLPKESMKKDIHPVLHQIRAQCSCGHYFDTYSTLEKLHLEICSACHPFYTGKQKLLDTEGRVDRFKKKWSRQKDILESQKKKGPRTVTIN